MWSLVYSTSHACSFRNHPNLMSKLVQGVVGLNLFEENMYFWGPPYWSTNQPCENDDNPGRALLQILSMCVLGLHCTYERHPYQSFYAYQKLLSKLVQTGTKKITFILVLNNLQQTLLFTIHMMIMLPPGRLYATCLPVCNSYSF